MWIWTELWPSLIRSRILTMNFPVLLEHANRRGACAIDSLSNISDVWYFVFPPRAFQKSSFNGKMSNKYVKVKRCKCHFTSFTTYQCMKSMNWIYCTLAIPGSFPSVIGLYMHFSFSLMYFAPSSSSTLAPFPFHKYPSPLGNFSR